MSSVYYDSIAYVKEEIKKVMVILEDTIKQYNVLIKQELEPTETTYRKIGNAANSQLNLNHSAMNKVERWEELKQSNLACTVEAETNAYEKFLEGYKANLTKAIKNKEMPQTLEKIRGLFLNQRPSDLQRTFEDYINRITNIVKDVYQGHIILKIHERLRMIASISKGILKVPDDSKESPLIYHLKNDEKIQAILHDELNQSDPRIVIINFLLDEDPVDEALLKTYLNEHSVKAKVAGAGYAVQHFSLFAKSNAPVPKSGESISTARYSITYHAPALEDEKHESLSKAEREKLLKEKTRQFFVIAFGWRSYFTLDYFGQCFTIAEDFVAQLRRYDHLYLSDIPIVLPTIPFEDTRTYRKKRELLIILYTVLTANGIQCSGFTVGRAEEAMWMQKAQAKISYNYDQEVSKYEAGAGGY
ncbi:MAG: hypothetical protein AB7F64_04520 [Gammaproteobacteria bacterium]